MDWFVRAYLKGSLVWFSIAILLAVAMALVPTLAMYRTAHLHIALLGFVTQMIYGVALHVIPRFFGQPLVHRRMAEVQFWTSQVGLTGLAAGFAMRITGMTGASRTFCMRSRRPGTGTSRRLDPGPAGSRSRH